MDSCPKRPSTKVIDHIHLIDNPVFEVNANWIFDNPLFEINKDSSLGYHEEDDSDFRIWKPDTILSNEYGSQDGNGDLTTVVDHWISLLWVPDFTPYRS